uniref:Murine leukemia virus integrase C-terminal domain-containing protein n=1 Tax=Callorhinchus milii TaxID=7868 RepID=A0A4W3IPJ5_CALMI
MILADYGKKEDSSPLPDRDFVYVKVFKRKGGLSPRWEGPYQILPTTFTAVKVQEKLTWVHASHCKKALVQDVDMPKLKDKEETDSDSEQSDVSQESGRSRSSSSSSVSSN